MNWMVKDHPVHLQVGSVLCDLCRSELGRWIGLFGHFDLADRALDTSIARYIEGPANA